MSNNIFDRIKSGEKIGTLILENSIREYVRETMIEEQLKKIENVKLKLDLLGITDYTVDEFGALKIVNKEIQNLNIPKGITSIESRFGNAVIDSKISVRELTIPDSVIAIMHNVFRKCRDLEIRKVSSSLEYIGSSAFENSNIDDNWLESLIENVKIIDTCAFRRCSEITCFKAGNKLEYVGKQGFSGCNNLKSIDLSETKMAVIEQGAFGQNDQLETVKLSGSIKEIKFGAFSNCKELKEINLNSVERIDLKAFENCNKLLSSNLFIESIEGKLIGSL